MLRIILISNVILNIETNNSQWTNIFVKWAVCDEMLMISLNQSSIAFTNSFWERMFVLFAINILNNKNIYIISKIRSLHLQFFTLLRETWHNQNVASILILKCVVGRCLKERKTSNHEIVYHIKHILLILYLCKTHFNIFWYSVVWIINYNITNVRNTWIVIHPFLGMKYIWD